LNLPPIIRDDGGIFRPLPVPLRQSGRGLCWHCVTYLAQGVFFGVITL
jgi:hypothetical protein